MGKRNGYYDFDFCFEDVVNDRGTIEDLLYVKDIQQRKFFLTAEITQETVIDIVRHIMQINKEDKGIPYEQRTPILIYVASNGGEVDSGFELIDVILSSKTPVHTVNMGYQYSMGFLIGLAGHKRFAAKNAKFLMHDGSNFVYGNSSKVQDRVRFDARVEERIREYVMSRSRVTPEEYDSKFRVEWYMFADEAKEKGFTDYIIGVDCDMDEIV